MDFATASASVNLGVPPLDLGPYDRLLERLEPMPWLGSVTQVTGLLLESVGPSVAINDFIEIKTAAGRAVRAQVVGFRNGRVLSMPLEEIDGVQLGDPVTARKEAAGVWVGPQLLGRVLDGFGLPLDGETVDAEALYPL